jgi:transposase
LAKHGYSRDHRPDRPQIVYGLLCNREGCPMAIEAFEGNTADPMTLSHQVRKLKGRASAWIVWWWSVIAA